MLRPAWPVERLKQEADRIWALHVKKNGPALLRNEAMTPQQEAQPCRCSTFGQLLDDRSPMPAGHHRAARADAGRAAGAGRRTEGRQERLPDQPARPHGGRRAVPRLHATAALRVFYLQAEIQYHYLRERLATASGSMRR